VTTISAATLAVIAGSSLSAPSQATSATPTEANIAKQLILMIFIVLLVKYFQFYPKRRTIMLLAIRAAHWSTAAAKSSRKETLIKSSVSAYVYGC
jgi:hypothetical protein